MEYTIANVAPIFLAPFFAFALNCLLIKKAPKLVDKVSVLGILVAFVFAIRIAVDFTGVANTDYYIHKVFTWFDLGETFKIDMGIYIDNMGAIMLLMVTGVASLIHIFSTWYMKGDVRYERFFLYMSLFTSAMLGLVLSDNLLSVFIFWEIMGFCSYSLIGFYFEKEKAGYASIKAFMTTRVGDVFFLLGILAIWHTVGSVDFVSIYNAVQAGAFGTTVSFLGMEVGLAAFAGVCIFLGTIGKSAQFPLQVWLPDAMMGPTPCSALIHAATMVAAGVYLSLRMYPMMVAGDLLNLIAMIGGITAFGAATIAMIQTDLKAVLAYSTISQLGYMVLGIGVGSYNAAFMHLITHAVFKACLFLSAGSVIHTVHTQEMPEMGGLRHKMKWTWIAMWCCTLAIAGVPIFSGFVSKDRILGDALYTALHAGLGYKYAVPALLGFLGAFLTPFYMCRMMFLTFHGKPRDQHIYDHAHSEHLKLNQNVPLLILSVFTLGMFFSGSLTGLGKIPAPVVPTEWFKTLVDSPTNNLERFSTYTKQQFGSVDTRENRVLEKTVYDSEAMTGYAGPNPDNKDGLHHAHVEGAIASVVIVACSIFLAFLMYIRGTIDPGKFVKMFSGWVTALKNKYYFDEIYIDVIIQKGLLKFNNFLAYVDMGLYDRYAIDGWEKVSRTLYRASRWFDDNVVDNTVDAFGVLAKTGHAVLRGLQSGLIQIYFIVLIIALAIMTVWINFIV